MDALMYSHAIKPFQIGIYEKAIPEQFSIGEMFELSKEAGFDFFELSIDRSDKRINRLYDQDFHKEIIESSHRIGFPLGSICVSALGTYTLGAGAQNGNLDNEKKAVGIAFSAIDFASHVGARIVQFPACDVPKLNNHTIETDRRFFKNLRKIEKYAASKSVIIGIENMEDDYMDNVSKCMRIINNIESPFLNLYPDTGNITCASKLYKNDAAEDLKKGKGKIVALHLKETRHNKYGGLFYGEGFVNFSRLVSTAWDMGIRRYVLEYWYTGNHDWKDDLISSRKLCEKWIMGAIDINADDEQI